MVTKNPRVYLDAATQPAMRTPCAQRLRVQGKDRRARAGGRRRARLTGCWTWCPGTTACRRRSAPRFAGLRLVSLRKGEYLFRMGARSPGWYGVVDGLVKWSSPGIDGKTLSLAGFSTGSWFGEATMLRAAPFDYEVVALRPSRVVILPRDICERLWNHSIAFTQALMMHLAQRVDWLMASYSGNVLLDVDTMVARAVAAQLAAESHSGTNGRLKISQEEIASLCGVSRQRCNAALTRLARDGVLQTRYGGLTILDSEALHEHAKLGRRRARARAGRLSGRLRRSRRAYRPVAGCASGPWPSGAAALQAGGAGSSGGWSSRQMCQADVIVMPPTLIVMFSRASTVAPSRVEITKRMARCFSASRMRPIARPSATSPVRPG